MRWQVSEGWSCRLLSDTKNDEGGIKNAVLEVRGDKVYSKLKFEVRRRRTHQARDAVAGWMGMELLMARVPWGLLVLVLRSGWRAPCAARAGHRDAGQGPHQHGNRGGAYPPVGNNTGHGGAGGDGWCWLLLWFVVHAGDAGGG